MKFEEFVELCEDKVATPKGLSPALRALRFDRMGDWDKAHEVTQEGDTQDGAWVHAYLHRKEGDISNARYWYSRAGRVESKESLLNEWSAIVRALLE